MVKINSPMDYFHIEGKMLVEYCGTNNFYLEENSGFKLFMVRFFRKKKMENDTFKLIIEFTLHDNVRYIGSFNSSNLYQVNEIEESKSYTLLEEGKNFIVDESIILDSQYVFFRGIIKINKNIHQGDNRDELYKFEIIFKNSKSFQDVLEEEFDNIIYFNNDL